MQPPVSQQAWDELFLLMVSLVEWDNMWDSLPSQRFGVSLMTLPQDNTRRLLALAGEGVTAGHNGGSAAGVWGGLGWVTYPSLCPLLFPFCCLPCWSAFWGRQVLSCGHPQCLVATETMSGTSAAQGPLPPPPTGAAVGHIAGMPWP